MRFLYTLYLILFVGFCIAQTTGDIIVPNFSCSGSLESGLNQLSQISGVDINYKQKSIEDKTCNSSFSNESLDKILTSVCREHGLSFSYVNNSINIKYPSSGSTVYGIILDQRTNERISNALVLVEGARTAVVSDANGNFRVFTTLDSSSIQVNAAGYQNIRRKLIIENNQYYIIQMTAVASFKEIEVHSNKATSLKDYDEISISTQANPTVGGELDALSNIKLLGGVQNVSFGESGLIVRGGGPDQNLVLVDGIPVYNTFHILGLYSIFNSTSINNIKVYKDVYPANYSSRLSSVVDVGLNNGSKKQWNAEADLGIISSGLHIDGPLIKDKLSLSGSVRRSYADALVKPIQNAINEITIQDNATNLWYYDVYGKLHYEINNKNEFSLSFYNGGDQLGFESRLELRDADNTIEVTDGDLGWRNRLIGGKWHSKFGSKLWMTARGTFSSYSVNFQDQYSFFQSSRFTSNSTSVESGLAEYRGAIDFDWFANDKNHVLFGLGMVDYEFKPFTRTYRSQNEVYSADTTISIANTSSTEFYAYAQDKTYFKNGYAVAGVRFVSFLRGNKRYNRFQPRVLINQKVNDHHRVKVGLSSIDQFIHLVPNNNLGLPLDIWLPVTEKIEPLHVEQLNAGIEGSYENFTWKSSIFSKRYSNILEYRTGVNLIGGGVDWDENFDQGTGISYGMEGQAAWSLTDWYLYGSYTFNRTSRQLQSINNGNEYFAKYDRPHTLNLLAQYQTTPSSKLIISFSFASGNPISLPIARYITNVNGNQIIVEEFGEINNYRLPATHHLDVAFQMDKEYKKVNTKLIIGVYNMYNQLNPFMAFIGVDEGANPSLKIRSYLPIMPMIKYVVKI